MTVELIAAASSLVVLITPPAHPAIIVHATIANCLNLRIVPPSRQMGQQSQDGGVQDPCAEIVFTAAM
jgi:hypothetical protein